MKLVYILISLVLLNSCINHSNKEINTTQIEGNYSIETISGQDVTPNKLSLSLTHLNHEVSGFSGCNRFSGNYTLQKNQIKFEPITTTKMMCASSKNDIETRLLDALTNINTFSIKKNRLVLKADTTAIITAALNSEKIE